MSATPPPIVLSADALRARLALVNDVVQAQAHAQAGARLDAMRAGVSAGAAATQPKKKRSHKAGTGKKKKATPGAVPLKEARKSKTKKKKHGKGSAADKAAQAKRARLHKMVDLVLAMK